MRALSLNAIQSGMCLGKTLFKGDGRVLLARGTPLTESYIESLRAQGFTALYVQDESLLDPPEGVVSDKARTQAAAALKEAFGGIRQGAGSSLNEDWAGRRLLRSASDALIHELSNTKEVLFQIMDLRAADDGYLFAHSVNVCVMGLALAKQMEVPQRKWPDLAMALLLHDVGVPMLAEKLRGPQAVLDGEEGLAYQQHCKHGHALLKGMSDTYGAICRAVALQHHEHWDGSGYPQGLSGQQIHPFAQICGIVNAYDRLTTSQAYGQQALPHEALEFLMGTGGSRYPFELVQSFLKIVAPYPIGTMLRLSTGAIGLVIKIDPALPGRPLLHLVSGEACDLNLAQETRVGILGVQSARE